MSIWMPKRKRTLKKGQGGKLRKGTGNRFTPEQRASFLTILAERREQGKSQNQILNEISMMPEAPSRHTLFRWKHQETEAQQGRKRKKLKPGPKNILSVEEKKVIGGWAIERLKKHKGGTRGESPESSADDV